MPDYLKRKRTKRSVMTFEGHLMDWVAFVQTVDEEEIPNVRKKTTREYKFKLHSLAYKLAVSMHVGMYDNTPCYSVLLQYPWLKATYAHFRKSGMMDEFLKRHMDEIERCVDGSVCLQ